MPGPIDITESTGETVPVDPQVRRTWHVTSIMIPITTGTDTVTAAEATWVLGMGTPAGELLIAPDGTGMSFAPATEAIGTTLPSGWRLRATMTTRLFDAAKLDRVRVAWGE